MRKMRGNNVFGVLKNLSRYDECYTPKDQVLPLLEYLDKDKTYYEATSGISSQIVDGFKKYEYNIVPSENRDFFTCGADDVYDGVVTSRSTIQHKGQVYRILL